MKNLVLILLFLLPTSFLFSQEKTQKAVFVSAECDDECVIIFQLETGRLLEFNKDCDNKLGEYQFKFTIVYDDEPEYDDTYVGKFFIVTWSESSGRPCIRKLTMIPDTKF